MIQEKKAYTVLCDNCGADSCDGTEYSSWSDAEQARYDAGENGWIEVDDKDYCPECVSYDDEDNLVLRTIKIIK